MNLDPLNLKQSLTTMKTFILFSLEFFDNKFDENAMMQWSYFNKKRLIAKYEKVTSITVVFYLNSVNRAVILMINFFKLKYVWIAIWLKNAEIKGRNTKKIQNQKSRTLNIKWSLNEMNLNYVLFYIDAFSPGKKIWPRQKANAVKYVLWFYSFYAIQDECYNEWTKCKWNENNIYIIFHLYIFLDISLLCFHANVRVES